MIELTKRILSRLLGKPMDPNDCFLSFHYRRHTQRRLEHLGSLGLPIAGCTVLEVGAGVGDHTNFFLDRGCQTLSTEARPENLTELRKRYPSLEVLRLDLDRPGAELADRVFDVVYCYGVLYHLENPDAALEFLACHCRKMLLVETCVSFGDGEALNPCVEIAADPSQSVSGGGCRPTRKWVYAQLRRHFRYVYMPVTQPWHEEFPLDWTTARSSAPFARSVFVGSRDPLDNSTLVQGIPDKQRRH